MKPQPIEGKFVSIKLADDPLDGAIGKVIDIKPWAQNGTSWRYLIEVVKPAELDGIQKWCWLSNITILASK
jgi:hypothetical protein